LLSTSRSSCTLAQYLSYHRPWLQFASEKQIAPLPIDPFEFSAFLISSSDSNRSAAPTKARCQAASFFSHLSGAHSPLQHPVCALVRDALIRKHASVRHPKTPLMAQHVRAMLLQHLTSQPNLATLLMSLRVAFMYEGCLRWSDLRQLTFGDCKQTPSSLRLCIPAAKNDHQHQGQWATIPASSDPLSAYMLYTRVLQEPYGTIWDHVTVPQRRYIMNQDSEETFPHSFPTANTSLVLSTDQSGQLPRSCPLVSYHTFLSVLNAGLNRWVCNHQTLAHTAYAELSSDWALLGIAPHIIVCMAVGGAPSSLTPTLERKPKVL